MALDSYDRPAVFATVKEAIGLTWELKVPYLVLVCLMMLPWVAAVLLGAMEPIESFVARSAETAGGITSLGEIPFGRVLQVFLGAIAVALVFCVFWFRYLLLGSSARIMLMRVNRVSSMNSIKPSNILDLLGKCR